MLALHQNVCMNRIARHTVEKPLYLALAHALEVFVQKQFVVSLRG